MIATKSQIRLVYLGFVWILGSWVVLGFFLGTNGFAQLPTATPSQDWTHPFNLTQPSSAPHTLLAVIEIPKGSRVKYEIDKASGYLMVDRLLPEGFAYPAHYGGLPAWWAADGDLMDVLVISQAPLVPLSLLNVVPVGLAKMMDGGEVDDKVLAIPISEMTMLDGDTPSLSVIGQDQLLAIETFFKTYKLTESGDNPIEWVGFMSVSHVLEQWCKDPIRRSNTEVGCPDL